MANRLSLGRNSTIRVRNSSVTRAVSPRVGDLTPDGGIYSPEWEKQLAWCGENHIPPCSPPSRPCPRLGHRYAGFEFDPADHQGGLDAGHVGGRGQVLDDEVLECRQVWGYALELEIRLAGQHVTLPHQGPGEHPVLESPQIGLGLAMQTHHGKAYHFKADALFVDESEVAGNHAGLLQRPHTSQAGRWRDADLAR